MLLGHGGFFEEGSRTYGVVKRLIQAWLCQCAYYFLLNPTNSPFSKWQIRTTASHARLSSSSVIQWEGYLGGNWQWQLHTPGWLFQEINLYEVTPKQAPGTNDKITEAGASLVAQWLGICLPMQGTRVRALVWEDPTCRGATKPVRHNYWTCASGACAP